MIGVGSIVQKWCVLISYKRGIIEMKNIINGKIYDTNRIFLDVLVSIRRIMQAIDLHSRYLFRNYGFTH